MSLEDTITYIAEHHPEQAPAKYGRSNWAEVFEKSGLFDVKTEAEKQSFLSADRGARNEKGCG